jgi:hypothetical protein
VERAPFGGLVLLSSLCTSQDQPKVLSDAWKAIREMDMEREHTTDRASEYVKPEVRDYGDLRELTAARPTGGHTDVPLGTPAPNVFS